MNISASACAKTILFGEHAVVYGEPAIAVPLQSVRTYIDISPYTEEFRIISKETELNCSYAELSKDSGLFRLFSLIQKEFRISELPNVTLTIRSDIPIASGLGSGAALSAAVIRAFSKLYNRPIETQRINEMVYEIEKVYHGTPSGIDNTVIVYEKPVIFIKGFGFSTLNADITHLPLLIADTGIRSRTVDVVSDVRANFARNEVLIYEIGSLVRRASKVLETGTLAEIGLLMNENQVLLERLDVSCPELNELIELARNQGAYGAKLTGAGRGGNFIVLCKDKPHADSIRRVFENRGVHVIS